MKKFVSLFVIAAVLAFAGTAFAVDLANTVDVKTATAPGGNAQVTGNIKTDNDLAIKAFYYVPASATTFPDLAIKVDVELSANPQTGSNIKATVSGGTVEGATVTDGNTTQDNKTLTVKGVPLGEKFTLTGIGEYSTDPADTATRKDAEVTGAPVTFSAKFGTADATKGVKIKAVDTTTVVINLDGAAGTDKVDFTNLVVVSDDTSPVTFATEKVFLGTGANTVKAEYDSSAKTVTLKVYGTPAAGLSGKLTLVGTASAPEIATNYEVAGIEEDDVILSIPVETVDYDVKPASTFIWDLEKSGDIVVSLDMLQDKFESVSLDVKSADSFLAVTKADGKMAETGVTSNDVTVKSCDIAAKDDHLGIEVTIGEFALAKLAPEKGNVVKRADLKAIIKGDAGKTATLDITIVVPAEEGPTSQDVAPMSTQQAAAVAALVANSADLGLTSATSHDANSYYVDNTVPSELSNDVRAYFEIDQPVATAGDYVALNGNALTVNKKSSGETVTFYKNFGTATAPDRIPLREAMSGDVLNAAVLIVDGPVPAEVKDAWKGKNTNQGVVIRKVNGVNVVVIYDGSADNEVDDPIYALVNRGSSSSSCDLGFGLVAVAGLAALALRKRSK